MGKGTFEHKEKTSNVALEALCGQIVWLIL